MKGKAGTTVRESLISTPNGSVRVYGPASPGEIESSKMDASLKCFRQPEKQKNSLVEIAVLPGGQVFIAVCKSVIVGYVTFHPPEKFERWGQGGIQNILELGAVEVSRHYRSLGLARALMEVAFRDGAMEDHIVIATEYYWHWDLEGSGLLVWEYRKMLELIMAGVGLKPKETNDPEINAHPANVLMVRLGKNVSAEDADAFEELCRRPEDSGPLYFDA